ncbi:hypothetical protein NPIL_374501 [Nephila pilipes]|uniref:Uncharacterized protein n=1 Tax=Nephila pilipes TaxID=299642 RepID=A0A8X6TBF0_NEPPI|nr:hypothetical protein NPIL_374501 [Nephila pilipes]
MSEKGKKNHQQPVEIQQGSRAPEAKSRIFQFRSKCFVPFRKEVKRREKKSRDMETEQQTISHPKNSILSNTEKFERLRTRENVQERNFGEGRIEIFLANSRRFSLSLFCRLHFFSYCRKTLEFFSEKV